MALKMSSTLPIMTPKEFLLQLPKVQDLTCDDTCPVCMEKYAPIKAPAPGIVERFFSMVVPREPESINHKLELAVRLPCQHVLGLRCIKRWVSPVEGGQCTCPYVSAPADFSLPLSCPFPISLPVWGQARASGATHFTHRDRLRTQEFTPSKKETKKQG